MPRRFLALQLQHRADDRLEIGATEMHPTTLPGRIGEIEDRLRQLVFGELVLCRRRTRSSYGRPMPVQVLLRRAELFWNLASVSLSTVRRGRRSRPVPWPGNFRSGQVGGRCVAFPMIWLASCMSPPLRTVTLMPVSLVKASVHSLPRPSCYKHRMMLGILRERTVYEGCCGEKRGGGGQLQADGCSHVKTP